MIWLYYVLTVLTLVQQAFGFQGCRPCQRITRRTTFLSANNNSNNGDDLESETPEQRYQRMKLVKQIQQSFYKTDETEESLFQSSVEEEGIIDNVPLFRVQWTELPGYQNILNIHVAHYTNMFRKIMAGPKPWRFGHVYLPGGSENLSNPSYAFSNSTSQATTIGTLMQISDVVEVEDGRLVMIVQGVTRFQVVKASQHVPYAMVSIRLLEDDEFGSTAKADFEEWNDWEVLPTTWDEPEQNGIVPISPLSNYNSQYFPDELSFGVHMNDGANLVESQNKAQRLVEQLEYSVWVNLDEMLRLLATASNLEVPVPSQLLGLLPTKFPKGISAWPKHFKLEFYANQLEEKNVKIGTFSKSPFVRVAMCESYPSLRRINRLSYAIWILLDTLLATIGTTGTPSRQELLEITCMSERLKLAYEHLDSINKQLRNIIPK